MAEGLQDFQTFRNETVNLLSGINKGKQRKGPIKPRNQHFHGALVPLPHLCQKLFSSRSNQHHLPGNTSRLFQRLNPSKPDHPTSQTRGPQASFLAVDDKQPRPSRQQTYTLTLTQQFSPLSVASVTGKESILGNIQSVMRYQQINTPQPFSPSDTHPHVASPRRTQPQEPPQQLAQPPSSDPSPSSGCNRLLHLPTIGPFQDYCCKILFRTTADS